MVQGTLWKSILLHHLQFLTPTIWQRWVRINYLSFVEYIVPLNVSQMTLCPRLYSLTSLVFVSVMADNKRCSKDVNICIRNGKSCS